MPSSHQEELFRLLKKLAREERLAFKKHALLRLYQRKISVDEIKDALSRGEVIESYPYDEPLPSFLVLGYTLNMRPLHVVVALDPEEEMVWVITAYQPSEEEWEEGFRRRKRGK